MRRVVLRSAQRLQRTDGSLLFFNAFHGQFADNPRAVYEQLARTRAAGLRFAWRAGPGSQGHMPPGVRVATRGTWDHARTVAQARWIVTNTWLEGYKSRGTRWVQTWHGTPLKRIAFDVRRSLDREQVARMSSDVAKWDLLLSPNAYSTEIFRSAFRYEGRILESGYPRNDVLSSPEAPEIRRRVRHALGIPASVTAVLYAPTWRDVPRSAGHRRMFKVPIDLARMNAELGDSHRLLIRMHRAVAAEEADLAWPFAQDVTGYADIRDLYLAADVLITDYSSVMFDFAITGKPMLFLADDLDSYRDDLRGFYFDFEAEVPGPVLTDGEEVIDHLRRLDRVSAETADRYDAFRDRFCSLDDGQASRRVVEALFDDGF